MWTTTLWNQSAMSLQWGAVVSASLLAASMDLYYRRIPNVLCGLLMVCGLVWAGSAGGWPGLIDALCGCLIMGVPFVLLFMLAGGGAGDAKFMGAIGAWMGTINGTIVLVSVVLAGGVFALCIALTQKRARQVMRNVMIIFASITMAMLSYSRWRHLADSIPTPVADEMQTLPYGVAIFAGVCFAAGGMYLWRL